jgi:hypothetical protein
MEASEKWFRPTQMLSHPKLTFYPIDCGVDQQILWEVVEAMGQPSVQRLGIKGRTTPVLPFGYPFPFTEAEKTRAQSNSLNGMGLRSPALAGVITLVRRRILKADLPKTREIKSVPLADSGSLWSSWSPLSGLGVSGLQLIRQLNNTGLVSDNAL